ncbi:MAG TPA: hypothetical protein VF002_00685 [Gaiellaceae bacterium]
MVTTSRHLIERGYSADLARTGWAAEGALERLDDAFRQYLAERSATQVNVEDVAALVAGAWRVRRAAQSLRALERMAGGRRLQACGQHLVRELHALQSWYVAFGYALVNRRPVPPPHIRDPEGASGLLACVREKTRGEDKASLHAALVLLLASQHLENLWRLEAHLGERANAASAGSRDLGPLRKLRLRLS